MKVLKCQASPWGRIRFIFFIEWTLISNGKGKQFSISSHLLHFFLKFHVSIYNGPVSGEGMLRWVKPLGSRQKNSPCKGENENPPPTSQKQPQDGKLGPDLDNWGSNPASNSL